VGFGRQARVLSYGRAAEGAFSAAAPHIRLCASAHIRRGGRVFLGLRGFLSEPPEHLQRLRLVLDALR